jgi:aspartyl-tRNA(Asn)/glutamyl-tRNA(Gln) amidotransferase subunit A
MAGLNELGICELRDRLEQGDVTAEAAVSDTLQAIEAAKDLNAFVTPGGEEAIEAAREIDRKREAGEEVGPLAGIPIALKDNLCVRGGKTTAGSRILEDFTSPYDATVVRKLRDAGAILIGKTNLDEFAMGSSNENSFFGPVKHPGDRERVPGGSSGGSAAAVAADLCAAALGSDTGGSIRQPASFTGVVGMKPTYGRVSRFGLIAFASSLDQIGPIAKNVADAAELLQVISGHDQNDMTSATADVPDFSAELDRGVEGMKLGVPKEYFDVGGIDDDVAERVRAAIDGLEAEGAEVVEISLPHTEYAVATYYMIATAEASSNLARFDGARYGRRAPDVRELGEMYERSRAEGFGAEVKRRIMLGTYVLSAGFYDAYYRKAQQVRTLIRQDFEEAFQQVDAIVTPTAPTGAFRLGEKTDDPLQMYLADIFTISCNLAGLPGISVPAGETADDLPVGLQVLTPVFEEARALRVAAAHERGHQRRNS